MRYFRAREGRTKSNWPVHGKPYECDHPMYDTCTLYLIDGKGLAVVQQRFNSTRKIFWWSAIDNELVDDIYNQPEFKFYFNQHCGDKDSRGLYPTVTVRQIMWALRMKPLRKEYWENDFDSQ